MGAKSDGDGKSESVNSAIDELTDEALSLRQFVYTVKFLDSGVWLPLKWDFFSVKIFASIVEMGVTCAEVAFTDEIREKGGTANEVPLFSW